MKHLHTSDLEFLEAFHDTEVSRPNPVNAIGVLSRADEIGVGRVDSMTSAKTIAARYREDARVRRLVQTVVPVAGLLAESAATLTQDEYAALSAIAALAPKKADELLLSTDRFVETSGELSLTSLERTHLLERFGVYGIRIASTLIRIQAVENARSWPRSSWSGAGWTISAGSSPPSSWTVAICSRPGVRSSPSIGS